MSDFSLWQAVCIGVFIVLSAFVCIRLLVRGRTRQCSDEQDDDLGYLKYLVDENEI